MTGILDTELFPDLCEVVEIPLHSQWVYLIQKNGNSGLRQAARLYDYKILVNEQLFDLDTVDVYIRNPRARYVSGINTFLQHLARDYPDLDQPTALWFAKRYKFLNRHYLPQFYWIQNLSRFTKPDAKIRLRNFADFSSIIDTKNRAGVTPATKELVTQILTDNNDLEFWLYLDQILLNLAGQSLTWSEIKDHYRQNFPDIAQRVLPQT